jgi:hypothetical protein
LRPDREQLERMKKGGRSKNAFKLKLPQARQEKCETIIKTQLSEKEGTECRIVD